MSFSRARIRRFNDDTGNTPAPGSYNPKFDCKIIGTGAVFEKCERFIAPKSNGGPDLAVLNTSFTAGRKSSSLSNLPVFRTPKIPQKFKKPTSFKIKAKGSGSSCAEENEKSSHDLESVLLQKELKIRDLEVDLELLREEYKKTEKTQNGLIMEITGRLDTFQDMLGERDATVASQEALLSLKVAEINRLEADLASIDKKQMKEKLRQLSSLNKTFKAENSDLSKVKVALDKKNDDLVKEIFKLQSVEKELQAQISGGENMIARNAACISNLEDKMELVQVENSAEKVILEDRIEDLNSQQDDLEKYLINKEETIVLLRKELEDAHQSEGRLNKKIQAVLADLNNKERGIATGFKEEYEKKIAQKQEMILLLQGELSEKELELEEISSDHTKVVEQNEWELARLCESEAKAVELSQKITDLTNNYKMLEENVMNASILKENLELTISCQQSAYATLQVDYDALRIDLEGRVVNQIMEASRKFSEISFELFETRAKLQYAENELSSLNASLMDLESRFVAALQERDALALARDELRVTNLEYQLTIADLHDKTDMLAVELSANSAYYIERVEKSRCEANILRQQCKIFEVGTSNLLESLEAVSARLMNSSRDSEAQSKEIINLKDTNFAFEKELHEQAEVLEAQKLSMIVMEAESIREIEEIRSTLQHKLEQLGARYRDANFKAMQEFSAEFDFLQVKISEMAGKFDKVDRKYSELQQLHSNLQDNFQARGGELEETKFDLLCLQDVLKEKEVKLALLENDIGLLYNNWEQQTVHHRGEMDAMLKSLSECDSKILAAEDTRDQLTEELAAKNGETVELKNQLAERLVAVQKVEQELETMKEENRSLNVELTTTAKLSEVASNIALVLTSKNGQMNEENAALVAELNIATVKCFEANKQIEELNSLVAAERDSHQHEKHSFLAIIKQQEDVLHSQAEREEQWSLLSAENIAKEVQLQEVRLALHHTSEKLDSLLAEKQGKDKQLTDLKENLQQAREELKSWLSEDWKSKYMEVASLVGPFRQQLEEFEAERHALEVRKEAADNQVKDLSLKYAQILGHQNHKQKIHHVIQLKEHNLELKQAVEKLEGEVRAKDKSIKKLKSDLSGLIRKNGSTPLHVRMPMTPLPLSKRTENTNPSPNPGHQSPNPKKVPATEQ